MFSFLSASAKPRSLFNPNLTLSPSSRNARFPLSRSANSSAQASVDFPDAAAVGSASRKAGEERDENEPESPVNQTVTPDWPVRVLRCSWVTPSCQVMLVAALTGSETTLAFLLSRNLCQFLILLRCDGINLRSGLAG